jgi:hypothetical protein
MASMAAPRAFVPETTRERLPFIDHPAVHCITAVKMKDAPVAGPRRSLFT